MWRVFHRTSCQISRFCYLLWVGCVMEVLATPCKCLREDPHKRLTGGVLLSMWSLCAINIDVLNKNNNNIIILMCACVGLYLFQYCGKVHVTRVDLDYLQGLGF